MRQGMTILALAVAAVACQDRGITVPVDDVSFTQTSAGGVRQVIGGGSIVREDIAGTPREIYGFQAQVDAEGNAWGEAEVHFPSDVVKMHIAVRCLVIERNTAWLSGPVTRSDDPETPLGRVFVWQVQDNGEGQGAPPDRISNFIHRPSDNYPPDVCQRKSSLTTFPWDNGNVRIVTPGGPSLTDLVGTWNAIVFYFVNPDDPADTVRLGATETTGIQWTVGPDGNYSMIWWAPGVIHESVDGLVDVVNGQMLIWSLEDPAALSIGVAGRVTGSSLYGEGLVESAYDWDGDDEEDLAYVVMEWRKQRTGVLIGDIAGTWDAAAWRYTSVTGTVRDVVAEGVALALAVTLDSRYHFTVNGALLNTGNLLFDGSVMLVRAESRESSPPVRWPQAGESRAFPYVLDGGTWSFSGPDTFDFDGDGARDPATLEVVLVRR